MCYLLVLLLGESAHSVLHDVALSAHKIANLVYSFFVKQLSLGHFKIIEI